MVDQQLGFGWDEEKERTDAGPEPLPEIAPLARRLRGLAKRGICLGTSSWKYPGWLGQVYQPARYEYRGKFARKRFDQTCLEEYAAVFPAVGGDFSFYQFPSEAYWERIFAQVPADFQFGLKVPEDVTVERFPKLPRYGRRAGTENGHFLDADMLRRRFLDPLEPYRDNVGVIMFEFGAIRQGSMSEPESFVDGLDAMLARLPTEDFKFAVEVRNRDFLDPGSGYLSCLRDRGVAHCLNSWTRMPALEDQLALPDILTANHVAARLLLRPGRSYQQAVDQFAPYEHVQDPYPEGRSALSELIERCLQEQRMLFAFVNNRFEGNAVETIEAVVQKID